MRKIIISALFLHAFAAHAQLDSFSREGVMYYTYDAVVKPVRTFYPRKSNLRLCPFCGQMQTEAHIKEQYDICAAYKSHNPSLIIYSTGLFRPIDVKRKYTHK
jgi:hypothetical protein